MGTRSLRLPGCPASVPLSRVDGMLVVGSSDGNDDSLRAFLDLDARGSIGMAVTAFLLEGDD